MSRTDKSIKWDWLPDTQNFPAAKKCNSSALLNHYMQNPLKIAFGDGILHFLNHVLSVCAACAQTWAELLQENLQEKDDKKDEVSVKCLTQGLIRRG